MQQHIGTPHAGNLPPCFDLNAGVFADGLSSDRAVGEGRDHKGDHSPWHSRLFEIAFEDKRQHRCKVIQRWPNKVKGGFNGVKVKRSRLPVVQSSISLRAWFWRIQTAPVFFLPADPASVNGGEIVVGQLAPLLFDLPLDLLPVSFDTIPVHDRLR